jgi:hypothetical protein
VDLVKWEREKTAQELHDEHVAAMWLMFLRAPAKPTASGEVVDLGEIGAVKLEDQRIDRDGPYSPASGLR